MLAAAFEAAGALVERIGPIADDEESHRAALERGLAADVLVSSGGVSVGPHDLVRRILAELGVEEDFWGVAVRPGKPVAFGSRGATLVFGLPGNPVSALVARRAVRAAGAARAAGRRTARPALPVGRGSRRRCGGTPARDELVRARTRDDAGEAVLEPVTGQESHMIARAAGGRRARARSRRRGRARRPASASATSGSAKCYPAASSGVGSSPGADTAIGFA